MNVVMVVSFIIVIVVMLLAWVTTSKAYSFKHTVDPIKPVDENSETQKSSND